MSNFKDILKEIGEFGLFQKRLVAALCIPSIFVAFDVIGQVFTGMNFPHQCNTDWILEQGPNLTDEKQRNLTIPVNSEGTFDTCKMFTPVSLDLETIERYGLNNTSGCTDGFDFEISKDASSIVTEFNLVCERSSFIEASQSIYMAGSPEYKFGRRFVVLLSLLILFVFGLGISFSPNIYVYIALKFVCGISTSGIVANAFVIGGEWSDSSKFALCTIICHAFYPLGLMILSGVAFFIRNWRILQMVLFSPLFVVLGIFYWILPESARWLITQGRKEEAIKAIRRAAKVNKRNAPEELLEKVSHTKNSLTFTKSKLTVEFLFFGIIVFIFGIVEFPARLGILPLLQHFGRKLCQAGVLIFGGAACLSILVIPKGKITLTSKCFS
uniref:Solute carrier family 22 member 13b n=1 Tax=Cyprinodon variegatus TaxID=28743 RepID=A0A3Q2EBB1_CYPVA